VPATGEKQEHRAGKKPGRRFQNNKSSCENELRYRSAHVDQPNLYSQREKLKDKDSRRLATLAPRY
jgi:hypothetical protein